MASPPITPFRPFPLRRPSVTSSAPTPTRGPTLRAGSTRCVGGWAGGGGLGGGGGRRIPHTSGGGKHMQMAFPFTPLCRRYSSLMLFPPALHCSGLGRLLWQCGLHHHQPVQRLEEGFGLLWLVLRMYDFITASHQSLEEPCERGIWMNGCCRRSNVDGCGLASWKDPGLFICD